MKKIIAFLIIFCMMISVFTSCNEVEETKDSITYQTKVTTSTSGSTETTTTSETTQTDGTSDTTETSSTEETTPPIQTEPIIINEDNWLKTEFFEKGWRYREIDLSDCKHKFTGLMLTTDYKRKDFIAEAAASFGYSAGSYEYDYFHALLGLSFYAALADYRIFEDYKQDVALVDVFFESYADPAYFQEPYEEILYDCFTILKEADFALYEVTIWETERYGDGINHWYSSHQYYTAEWTSRLGLLFSDIDAKLLQYAKALLALPKRYPMYQDEFALSKTMIEAAEAIVKACEPIDELREEMMKKWGAYYQNRANTMQYEVKYELIPDMGTIKLTFISEGNGFMFDNEYLPWIKDLNGVFIQSSPTISGYLAYGPNASPATVYMPIKYYYEMGGNLKFYLCDENETKYEKTYHLSLDLNEHEGNPVEIKNEFLDAALKKQFGGSYTDVDLCKITELDINYRSTSDRLQPGETGFQSPTITFTFYNAEYGNGKTTSSHRYYELFGENFVGEASTEIKKDIMKFHCLNKFSSRWIGNSNALFSFEEMDILVYRNRYTAEVFVHLGK